MMAKSISLPDVAQQTFDVAIVGSGPAGIAAACRLQGKGLRIIILEAGGASFRLAAQAQAFRATEVQPPVHPPGELYRRRMLGGTSTIWGGRCIAFDETDFDSITAGDGARWPLAPSDVGPYVPQAHSWLDAGAPEFFANRALPNSSPVLLEGDAAESMSLGEIERFSPPLDVWRRYGGILKNSRDVVVFGGACCNEIISESGEKLVKGLSIRTPDGNQILLKARIYIVATGGLETPRLLLASRSGRSLGLGNEYDLVGRFYMTHLIADVGMLALLDPKKAWLDYELSRDGVYVRRLLKLTNEERRKHGLLNAIGRPSIFPVAAAEHGSGILSAAFLFKRFILAEYRRRLVTEGVEAPVLPHIANVLRDLPGLGKFGLNWLRKRIFASRKLPSLFLQQGPHVPLEWIAEQAPNRSSRVTLSDEKDLYGMPRLNISWSCSDDDIESFRKTLLLTKQGLSSGAAARLEVTESELRDLYSHCRPQGGHHIGTARMGNSERDGVVDRWGRVWNAPNVYIVGSSTFPRSGAANPTLMLVALAMRTADHIARTFNSGRTE